MKKILAVVTISVLLLTGCTEDVSDNINNISSSGSSSNITHSDVNIVEDSNAIKVEEITSDDLLSGEEVLNNIIEDKEIIDNEDENQTQIEETEIFIETNIPEEPEIIETTIRDYKITDIALGGRDITTYGDFPEEFVSNLESILDAYSKNISLAVYSLDGSKAMVYNGNQQYFSACTVKIPWMLYLCQEIDAGRVDKDTVITYEEKHYHKGSGSIRKGSYGDTYTIEQLINLCLSISDNVAYEMLVQEVIDRNDFYKFLEQFEFDRFQIPSYSIWCSNAIPTDFLMIWEGVYEYFKTETIGSQILKTACTNTKWNYGTATLQNYDYSHKSGDNWEPNAAHNDAGIVWAETPYLYAIFTKSEGNDYDERNIDAVMGLIHKEFCK